MKWNELKEKWLERREDRQFYFSEQADEILTANLHIFIRASAFCSAAVILYIFVIALLLRQWEVTVFHIALLVVSLLNVQISVHISRHRLKHKSVEKLFCVLYSLWVFLMLICMDTIASPDSSQIYSSAFLVIGPAIFIMTPSRMIIDQLFFVVTYAFFAFNFKTLSFAVHDMYAIWAGFFLGIILYLITLDLRLKGNAEVIRLKHFSEIDELTKIKNRRAANAQISYMLQHREPNSACAMMMLDVDCFKAINDTYGHKAGDEVLVGVANVLAGAFRKTDVVSRFGGDEFLVFVSDFVDDNFLRKKCEEIQANVHHIMQDQLAVSCSIGMCILTTEQHTMDELVHAADEALYQTKERQKGTYTINVIS